MGEGAKRTAETPQASTSKDERQGRRCRQAKQGLGRGQDRAQEAASKDRGRPHCRLGSRRRLRSCVGRLLPVHQGAWCRRGGRRRWWTLSVNRAVLCAREGSIRSPGPFETRRRKGGGEVQSRAIKTKQKTLYLKTKKAFVS